MKRYTFNGIHEDHGGYAFAQQTSADMRHLVARQPILRRLQPARQRYGTFVDQFVHRSLDSLDLAGQSLFDTIEESDRQDLAKMGWGLVVPAEQSERLKQQLAPLLALRRAQSGGNYREITFRKDQMLEEILEEHNLPAVGTDPRKMPYYLLLVGTPEQIPFNVQYGLDRRWAVGRLAFDDLEAYGRYARQVVRNDQKRVTQMQATFFGTRHLNDSSSQISTRFLVENVARRIKNQWDAAKVNVDTRTGAKATKKTLTNLMGGSLAPHLLLVSAHGLIPSANRPNLAARKGALLCAEYPGPNLWKGKSIPARMVFYGREVPDKAAFGGMIAALYACYSGGTPVESSFALEPHRVGRRESNKPFIAQLPQRMLGVEDGCGAVLAHIDTTFVWSLTDGRKRDQSQVFQAFFSQLLKGRRVGSAAGVFQQAYLERLARYSELVQSVNGGRTGWEDDRIVQAWMAVNDLRNYVLLGDPAVRLPHLQNPLIAE